MNADRSGTDAQIFHRNLNFESTQPNHTSFSAGFSHEHSVARNDQLIVAAHRGDVEQVRHLLGNGASATYHCIKSHRVTALCMASSKGHIQTMQLLLNKGAHINAMTNSGFDALYFAAVSFQAEAVDYLIKKGAIRKQYISYDHPVSLLMETLSILMPGHGLEMNDNKLLVVKLLLKATNRPNGCIGRHNCKHPDDQYPDSMLSPLIQIVKSDKHTIPLKFKFALCELLKNYGVNPNESDPSGNTALHYATRFRCTEMVSNLIDMGVDVHAKNCYNKTARDNACLGPRTD